MTDIGNNIYDLINNNKTKKNKLHLTKKYIDLFNNYKSIIQVKNPKVYNLIMRGNLNEMELDWIQRVLKETYDANANDNLKQKDINDRLQKNLCKKHKISKWKIQGMKSADWNSTYNLWLNCRNCEICDIPFLNHNEKRLDHDHNIDHIHNIRWVLCCSCNNQPELKNYKNNINFYNHLS